MALVLGTNCGFCLTRPSADPGGTAGVFDTWASALKVTAPAGATRINEVGVWIDNATEAANMDVGIYSHDSGNNRPLTLLGSATIAKGTTAGWKYGSVDVNITPGTIYWVAGQVDDTATQTNGDVQTDATQKNDYKASQTSLPASWAASSGTVGRLFACYTVYSTTSNFGLNIGDAWKNINSAYLNVNDVWKPVTDKYLNVNDVWKPQHA